MGQDNVGPRCDEADARTRQACRPVIGRPGPNGQREAAAPLASARMPDRPVRHWCQMSVLRKFEIIDHCFALGKGIMQMNNL